MEGAGQGNRFKTTRWSVIVAAGQETDAESREAIATLCEQYWFPLYSFVRRRGYREEEAKDLTQEFFEQLLSKNLFKRADRDRGRFRSFLLGSMKHFLANDWDRTQAQKRGGGQQTLSLDFDHAENLLANLPAHETSWERAYDREWAQTLLAQGLHDVEVTYRAEGKGALFQSLKPLLTGGTAAAAYRDLGVTLDMSEGAVKVAAHRLRKRYGEALRARIAETLNDSVSVDEELKYLISLL